MSALFDTDLFVLDLDGTVYLDDRLLPGAAAFVSRLRANGTKLLYFTNNSSLNGAAYAAKLKRLGLPAAPGEIMSSADVMIDYLNVHHAGEAVCLLATAACAADFAAAGIRLDDTAGLCVAAFDTELTYAKLARFSRSLMAATQFYATHADLNCPVDGGIVPDLGAILALLEAATGRRPDAVVGKPHRPTVEAISRRTGVPPERMTFVGDRLYTDIAVASRHGAKAILVLSGATDAAMLAGSPLRPDAVFADLAGLSAAMRVHA